jgi:uncharacterized membrane protein
MTAQSGETGDEPRRVADVADTQFQSDEDSAAARVATAAVGGSLVEAGVTRRSLGGAALAAVGGWLAYRGLRGRRPGLRGTDAEGGVLARDDPGTPPEATEVERSITVGKPAEELYEIWRDPEQLPRIMAHFADVTPTDENRQHWEVRGPLGRVLAWDARVVKDRPGELVQWESLPNEGSVRFRPASSGRGTEVTVRLRFDPPGGRVGNRAMDVFDVVPGTVAEKSLDRFKSLAETGEIPTLEGDPSARGAGDLV